MQRNDPPRWTRFFTAGFAGIERVGRSLRVAGDAADRRQLPVVVRAIPIADPLPHVAGDVMEPVAVRGELRHWRESRERIRAGIVIGKVTLMAVGHPPIRDLERIAPGEELPRQAAARRKFPFRFRRQPLAGPPRIRERVFIRHVNDRPSILPLD